MSEWKPPHYCNEWDGMWITRFMPEWEACICTFAPPEDGEERAHRDYIKGLEEDKMRLDWIGDRTDYPDAGAYVDCDHRGRWIRWDRSEPFTNPRAAIDAARKAT